jgi:periplasmic divalent cation tolerance protein
VLYEPAAFSGVNIMGPAESSFWWQGKIDRAREYLLLIKTRTSQFVRLRQFLERHHPYSVPEIVALPIEKANAPYLNWIRNSV